MAWNLEPYGRGGGISGEGVKNLLEATGFRNREDLIVREAGQNSVDAHDDVKEHKVKVVFRKLSLKGKEKRKFVDLLGLGDLAKIGPLLKTTPKDSPLRDLDGKPPLDLLYIEDYNTKGLGGGLTDLQGNYYRLLFLVGDAMKAESEEDLGGSYGYGKSVYSSNSATSTIVTFSVFKPDAKSEGSYARLLGSTFQKAFTHKGKDFTGRGWFGGKRVEDDVPDPIADEEALTLAEQLGFQKREKKEYGTSILLIGTQIAGEEISTDKLREAIETWWWPRYIEDRLDVELYEDGKRKEPPRPKQRQDLAPYIDCFSQIGNGGSQDVTVQRFNAHPGTGLQMGVIALKAVSEDLFANRLADEPGPGARRVAMMRGPSMVVDYHSLGTERREAFIGVYRAPADINTYLKLSEPKEHHRWDPKARRLQNKPHGADVVESVMRRCAVQVRDFQASLAPKREQPRDRLDALDKLLGAAFASLPGAAVGRGGGGSKSPTYGKAIIEFPKGVKRIRSEKGVRLQTQVRIMLRPDEKSPQKAIFRPGVVILEDANRAKGRDEDDLLEVEILEPSTKKQVAKGRSPAIKVQLFSDKWVYFEVATSEYNPDWFSEMEVTVD
jgi:hypothetical protein